MRYACLLPPVYKYVFLLQKLLCFTLFVLFLHSLFQVIIVVSDRGYDKYIPYGALAFLYRYETENDVNLFFCLLDILPITQLAFMIHLFEESQITGFYSFSHDSLRFTSTSTSCVPKSAHLPENYAQLRNC